MMRRLPIFIIADVSNNIDIIDVNEFISDFIRSLKSDPFYLEVAHITVVSFANEAKTELEYQELENVEEFELELRNCISMTSTDIEEVLKLIKSVYEKNYRKTTVNCKGDWTPIVIWLSNAQHHTDRISKELISEYGVMFPVTLHFSTIESDDSFFTDISMTNFKLSQDKHLYMHERNVNPGGAIDVREDYVYSPKGYEFWYKKD